MIRRLTWKDYIKGILVGFLWMILSLIATAAILVTILAVSQKELAIGPLYLLVPVLAFSAGCFRSLRRASRPSILEKPASTSAIFAKSTVAGLAAVLVSVIAYLFWIRMHLPPTFHGVIGIDIRRAVYWPVMLAIFLAGFILTYRRASH
jgi:hypothetical protein